MQQELVPTIEDKELPSTWSKDYRGVPNALARSALFCVRRAGERIAYKDAVIASSGDVTLIYSGEELRQDDEDVFLHIVNLAKELKLGEDIEFSANSVIADLKWTRNTASYDRLTASLKRMQFCSLEMDMKFLNGAKLHFGGALISSFAWRERFPEDPQRVWVVSLQKNIVQLFDPQAYSLIHWPTRRSLTPVAKWLHSYYSSHKIPFPVKVETLKRAMASETKGVRTFRASLREALALLVEKEFLISGKIEQGSDLVYVERKADKKLIE